MPQESDIYAIKGSADTLTHEGRSFVALFADTRLIPPGGSHHERHTFPSRPFPRPGFPSA